MAGVGAIQQRELRLAQCVGATYCYAASYAFSSKPLESDVDGFGGSGNW
jgi:hypothetical protein